MINEQQKPYVQNASDKKQIKEAGNLVRREHELRVADMRKVLATSEGRRALWRILEVCGIYKESFTGSSETFYREGKRSIGLLVLGDIMDADPDMYLKMIQEQRKEK